ncbi:MAG: CDP-glucose 4,6-dehydratase [Lachnospiraceae bacterium]
MPDKNFWKNKTVLVTGHTGFKGSWLCIWLLSLGAKVIGYALDPHTEQDNYVLGHVGEKIVDIRGDIRDRRMLEKAFKEYKPEIVFHLAAQPLVLTSYEKPYDTYEINVMGTLNVLECVRGCVETGICICITTDKCYANKDTMRGYVETDPFGGFDPYSASKACDEIMIESYRNSFFPLEKYDIHRKAIASVRAGNVIGGGDWADHRILPDCIRCIEKNADITIRNRHAVRPWQHVLEPLGGYILLAERLAENPQEFSGGWNFGPREDSIWNVWSVAEQVVEQYGKGVLVDASEEDAPHEAGKLVLNIEKAEKILGWKPRLCVEDAIKWTVDWYKNRDTKNVYEMCLEQIEQYEALV